MFSELPLSSIPSSIQPVLSIPTSPISSAFASPLSSEARSRTSTITSISCVKTGLLSSTQQHHRQMKIGKYFLERTIGKGNFAVVKLATHCDTHQKVAIKIIDKSRLEPNDHIKLEREITVMKSLIHPYIIRLYEVMESKNLIYLVTEYAPNGELLDLLLREKRLSEPKAKEKFRQLVLAVDYIHSKNIVHRDLKAENLLLDSHGNIKVADFGFANTFTSNTKLQTFCGSPPYAAPELYQCLPYTPEKVDVWSLGVLLYVFVCGHLPFDSNNLAELRKRIFSGQFRLPFYISSDCSSLISYMLTVDPEQRYTINDIKKHPWMMLNNCNISELTSQTQSIPNCQLINAILDHAELLGYNRTNILKSVWGNSYDSDAAIWHLLLEKFQQTCQINTQIPIEETNNSDIVQRPTFDDNNIDLVYYPPNRTKSVQSQIDPCDLNRLREPEIHIDYTDNYDDDDDDDDDDDEASEQIREQYARLHGLRRYTAGRPDLLIHGQPMPVLVPTVRSAHQSTNIEPSILTNRLTNLQQRQECNTLILPDDNEYNSEHQSSIYHQRNPHSTSYNGLSMHSAITASSDVCNPQQRDNNWLSPPVPNQFDMNRRASDSGAQLRLFEQQHNVTGSNTIDAARPTLIQSPLSNQSSPGSITRGAPITTPTFAIIPHEAEEDNDEDAESLARYLNRGKRHTVCEQGLVLGGKARRSTRDLTKDRVVSRRASDTSSNLINNSTRTHLERLYNNAVNSKGSDDDDVTTSSLQELQKLKKQVQKYPVNNNTDSPGIRRAAAVSSPTNSAGLHMIREEHRQNPFRLTNSQNKSSSSSSSSSSSEALPNIDDDENEMDCDINTHHSQQQFIRPSYRAPYHHQLPPPYYCSTSPLIAQYLPIPTTTSSYIP